MSTTGAADSHLDVAEAAWRWVLDQVRWDDTGPWIPQHVSPAAASEAGQPPAERDGMHSGVGGLAHALAEIRLARELTSEESDLAGAVAVRVRAAVPSEREVTYFDGLVSHLGVLLLLDEPGADTAIERLTRLAQPDGWPTELLGPPAFDEAVRIHDATLGSAGVLLGAVAARRAGVPGATELAARTAEVLLDAAEPAPTGLNCRMVPTRLRREPRSDMPNYSHGLAGIATALGVAGAELGRADLLAASTAGATHLVSLADLAGYGFVVPRMVPPKDNGDDPVTYTWCHGPAGTSLLFAALDRAGVDDVAGESPASWHRRCLRSVRTSGVPARLHPGFWDNDGRCCGTAGVGDVFLDAWQRLGADEDLDFALHLADVLVERSLRDGPHAYWRFVEHRAPDPLLPPGVGWMQGAAGIAAFLFRAARVVETGPTAPAVRRLDTWWALPEPA